MISLRKKVMRALIVGNHGDCDPGLVGSTISDFGFSLVRNEREFPREWKSLTGIDLVISLGSDWSVYSEQNIKEREAEVNLIHAAIVRGVPVFAICYGAQLLSHVLGGSVSVGISPEIGWKNVYSSAFAEIFSRDWFQWHYDAFTVPSSLQLIASNEFGTQAMLGNRLLATQFHPEVTGEIINRWFESASTTELELLGLRPEEFHTQTVRQLTTAVAATNRLVTWFIECVATTKPFQPGSNQR